VSLIPILFAMSAWSLLAGSSYAAEPAAARLTITRLGSQAAVAGSASNFTGAVRVDSRFQASAPGRVSGGLVTFEPGARTAWHSHPLGQTLIVTAGVGLVGEWGNGVEEMRPGDIVWIPPGVKHWHGASRSMGMSHVAIAEQSDGKTADWMEKVSDEQYGAKVTH
jgi:quercetin dioxygenase-like cupin family protein